MQAADGATSVGQSESPHNVPTNISPQHDDHYAPMIKSLHSPGSKSLAGCYWGYGCRPKSASEAHTSKRITSQHLSQRFFSAIHDRSGQSLCTNNPWVPGDMQAVIGSTGVGPSRRCLDLFQSGSPHSHPANVPPQQLATYPGNQYTPIIISLCKLRDFKSHASC